MSAANVVIMDNSVQAIQQALDELSRKLSKSTSETRTIINRVTLGSASSTSRAIGSTVLGKASKGRPGKDGINGVDGDTFPTNMIIELASQAPITSITGDPPASIAYTNYENVTNHTRTIAYTGWLPTNVVTVFDYGAQRWTLTKTISYVDSMPASSTLDVSVVNL